MRKKLVEPLKAELEKGGGHHVFYDQTSAPGIFPEDILQGILSTRGGGVVVFLISKTYLDTEWTQIELACAWAARKIGGNPHLRLLVILLDRTVEQFGGHVFVRMFCAGENGDHPLWNHQLKPLPSSVDRNSHGSIIHFICEEVKKKLGNDFVSGGTRAKSFIYLQLKLGKLFDNAATESFAVMLEVKIKKSFHKVFDKGKNLGRFSETDVSPLITALEYFELDKGVHMVRRYQYKWLDSWKDDVPYDLQDVKFRVEEWRKIHTQGEISPPTSEKIVGKLFKLVHDKRIDVTQHSAILGILETQQVKKAFTDYPYDDNSLVSCLLPLIPASQRVEVTDRTGPQDQVLTIENPALTEEVPPDTLHNVTAGIPLFFLIAYSLILSFSSRKGFWITIFCFFPRVFESASISPGSRVFFPENSFRRNKPGGAVPIHFQMPSIGLHQDHY